MTLILDLINGIHKFLGYLDISPKYLNRAYTILSIIPTAYILMSRRPLSKFYQTKSSILKEKPSAPPTLIV